MLVTQAASPRRPTTTAGTTSTERASSVNPNEPNATAPVPGACTSSRTTACAARSRHQAWASAKRSGPVTSKRGGLTPADEPVAAADPGQRVLGGEQVEQGRRQLDALGAYDEGGGGGGLGALAPAWAPVALGCARSGPWVTARKRTGGAGSPPTRARDAG